MCPVDCLAKRLSILGAIDIIYVSTLLVNDKFYIFALLEALLVLTIFEIHQTDHPLATLTIDHGLSSSLLITPSLALCGLTGCHYSPTST